jgi:uncharacterized protein YukE
VILLATVYDDASTLIKVDPDNLFTRANVDMMNNANVIADAISSIVQTWNGLALGWAGATAAEAQDFSDRWTEAVRRLFGTKDDPTLGVLPKMASGVAMASINYGEAEATIEEMFLTLYSSLAGPSDSPVPPTRDQDQGPVTENAPAPP